MNAARSFTADDLRWFAEASGDWNPIHVDPVQARRLVAGEQVVHGMLTLLWALDVHCGAGGEPVSAVAASFARPVGLGDRLALASESTGPDSRRLSIRCEGAEVLVVLLTLGGARIDATPPAGRPARDTVEVHAFAELKGASGQVPISASADDLAAGFPHASRVLGPAPVAGLMALSRLVGMRCPGLHSLFAGLDITFDAATDAGRLVWSVVRHTVAQAPLRLSVEGGGLSGRLDAFVRPAPVAQAAMPAVAAKVRAGAFDGHVGLVVGGSRGLGELAAKVIASGGGRPLIGYLHGADDARRVADEIVAWGGLADTLRIDADQPVEAVQALRERGLAPTHLYYFAAPRIAPRKGNAFDAALWRQFGSTFVEGFARVVHAVRAGFDTPLQAFYPSTTFLDERPAEFAEYIAAKAAGEALCAQLAQHTPALQILVRRLPRLPTDQTAGLIRLSTADPLPLLVGVVEDMHAAIHRPETPR